jgi:hypothetical protein
LNVVRGDDKRVALSRDQSSRCAHALSLTHVKINLIHLERTSGHRFQSSARDRKIENSSGNAVASIRRMTSCYISARGKCARRLCFRSPEKKMEKLRRMTQVRRFNLQSERNFEHLYGPAALFSLRKHC